MMVLLTMKSSSLGFSTWIITTSSWAWLMSCSKPGSQQLCLLNMQHYGCNVRGWTWIRPSGLHWKLKYAITSGLLTSVAVPVMNLLQWNNKVKSRIILTHLSAVVPKSPASLMKKCSIDLFAACQQIYNVSYLSRIRPALRAPARWQSA